MFALKDYLFTKMASSIFGRIWKCLIQGNTSLGSLLGIPPTHPFRTGAPASWAQGDGCEEPEG